MCLQVFIGAYFAFRTTLTVNDHRTAAFGSASGDCQRSYTLLAYSQGFSLFIAVVVVCLRYIYGPYVGRPCTAQICTRWSWDFLNARQPINIRLSAHSIFYSCSLAFQVFGKFCQMITHRPIFNSSGYTTLLLIFFFFPHPLFSIAQDIRFFPLLFLRTSNNPRPCRNAIDGHADGVG